jgi:AcrR family transcriptional regulator
VVREKQAQVTRTQIESTALRLFAEQGYAATSTRSVARDSGVSEGLIFHHYGTKDGLLASIVQSRRDLASSLIGVIEQHVLQETKLHECLESIREALVTSIDADNRFFVMLASESFTNERVRNVLSEILEQTSGVMATYLESRKSAGEIRSDCDAASAANTLVRSLIGLNFTGQITGLVSDLEASIQTLMDVFERGMIA